jgi:hypothetical protein
VSEAAPEPGDGRDDDRPRDGEQSGGAEARRVVVTRRRAPRYRAFGLTGGVVGVAVGLALGLSREPQGDYTQQAIVGYFATALGLIGALLGLAVALLAERLTSRR